MGENNENESEPPTLPNIAKELMREDYWDRAAERKTKTRSWWTFPMLIFAVLLMVTIWYGFVQILWLINIMAYPSHIGHFHDFIDTNSNAHSALPHLMSFIPPFFAALPIAFMLSNVIERLIPAFRHEYDAKAKGVKWASYTESQKGLLNIAKVLVPLGLGLGLIGTLMLKSLP